jgi:hypothetical protein
VAELVEALRYKPEGRGFVSLCVQWFFHVINPSGRTMASASDRMSARNISWGVTTLSTVF